MDSLIRIIVAIVLLLNVAPQQQIQQVQHSVSVGWKGERRGGLMDYVVYRDGAIIGTTDTDTFLDEKIESSGRYTYTVTASCRNCSAKAFPMPYPLLTIVINSDTSEELKAANVARTPVGVSASWSDTPNKVTIYTLVTDKGNLLASYRMANSGGMYNMLWIGNVGADTKMTFEVCDRDGCLRFPL